MYICEEMKYELTYSRVPMALNQAESVLQDV